MPTYYLDQRAEAIMKEVRAKWETDHGIEMTHSQAIRWMYQSWKASFEDHTVMGVDGAVYRRVEKEGKA